MRLFGPRKVSVDRLIQDKDLEGLGAALYDEDPEARHKAADYLRWFADERVVVPLIDALRDEQPRVRSDAAAGLGRLQARDSRSVEPLIAALGDERPGVRQTVATSLGQIGDARAVEPLMAALDEEDENMRAAAAEALEKLGHGEALLQRAADQEPAEAVQTLSTLVEHADVQTRAAAARMLLDRAEVVTEPEVLAACFEHGDPDAKQEVAKLLLARAEAATPSESGPLLAPLLRGDDPEARALAQDFVYRRRPEAEREKLDSAERLGGTVDLCCEQCHAPCTAASRDVEQGSVVVMTPEMSARAARYCASCNIVVCGTCAGASASTALGLQLGGRPCPRCRHETEFAAIRHVRMTQVELV